MSRPRAAQALPEDPAASTSVSSSPAISSVRPIHSSGAPKASAANAPMSSTAISWSRVVGFTPCTSLPAWMPAACQRKLSMKNTGRRIVAGSPSAAMRRSISCLLTKCGTSGARSAPPTLEYTKCAMPASAAAWATLKPASFSAAMPPGPRHVCIE